MRHRWSSSWLIVCVALLSARAHAEPQPAVQKGVPTPSPVVLAGKPLPPEQPIAPLVWHGQRFSALNYTLTGVGAAVTLATSIVKPRAQHSLSGGLWFDEGVRDLLRADELQRRYVF